MTIPDTSLPPAGQPTARVQMRDMKNQAIDQARQTIREARDSAASSLGDSKNRFADQIGGLAQAFRQVSDQLRSDDQARIAGFTDTVTAQIDQLATYIRDRDGRAVLKDLEQLAHRRPAWVIGGALTLGLLAARFIKSSERREGTPDNDRGGSDGD